MNGTFLIVEDQESDALFLKHALSKAGVDNPIQVVEDGLGAIAYLKGEGKYADRQTYAYPVLMFLDLKLPNVNGFEVLHWMREQRHLGRIVVVVMTSSSLGEDVMQAYRLGANSYVVKPASLEKLVETMQDFAKWWLRDIEWRTGTAEVKKLSVAGLPA